MRRIFLALLILSALLPFFPGKALADDPELSLRHVRNATTKLSTGGATFLIDPMLAEPGAYEGFPDT